MKIEYLQKLRENPYEEINNKLLEIKGISEAEINSLEQTWNNGNSFPKALKELLFLAGENFPGFSYGIGSTQNEFQVWIREHIARMSRVIDRHFFSINFFGGIDFTFVYLDEGDNPFVYHAYPYEEERLEWFTCSNLNLKDYIERIIFYTRKQYEEIENDKNF